MAKVLLIYDQFQKCVETQKSLNSAGHFDILLYSAEDAAFGLPPLDLINIVLFECNVLDSERLRTLKTLSDQTADLPVLILAEEISIDAFLQISSMRNMVALQKPFQEMVFASLITQLLSRSDISRVPRFYTDQPVRMIVLNSGLLIPTRMKNYSAGGAFLEYKGISLKIGDKIQVGFLQSGSQLSNLQLQAKVIWIKEGDGPRSPARGVGIQFLDASAG